MTSDHLGPYRVSAFNTAHDSDNKIHDSAFARSLGFGGGMVPGVAVYGYMTHLPVIRWGRAWLERGTAECRFFKPVYDGDIATVTASLSDGALDISVESRGEVCATGRAAMPDAPPIAPPRDLFPKVPQRAERPPADEASLAVETWLGLDPYPITPEESLRYLADLREAAPIYAEAGLIHPALILQSCNLVLNRNVVIGPWVQYRQPGAEFGDGLGRRQFVGARPRHRQLRAQEPPLRRNRRPGPRRRDDPDRSCRAHRDISAAPSRCGVTPRGRLSGCNLSDAARRGFEQRPGGGVETGPPARREIAEPGADARGVGLVDDHAPARQHFGAGGVDRFDVGPLQ